MALRDSTVAAGASITDLHYQIVLSNLAMFRQNPDALPWHVKVTGGAIQITDSLQPSMTITWPNTSRVGGLLGGRAWAESWNVAAAINSQELRRLQGRYRAAAGADTFSTHFGEGPLPGGSPVGRYGDRYVWVKSGQLAALTELTLGVLSDAPVELGERPLQIPGVPLRNQ